MDIEEQLREADKAGFSLPEIKEPHTHDWHILQWRATSKYALDFRAITFTCLTCDEVKEVK